MCWWHCMDGTGRLSHREENRTPSPGRVWGKRKAGPPSDGVFISSQTKERKELYDCFSTKHESFHNSKLWPEDDKLWVWTFSGARPSGSHGTSLTFLKHLQSTSRQVISSNSQRFAFLGGGGFKSYFFFTHSPPTHTHTLPCELQKKTNTIQH